MQACAEKGAGLNQLDWLYLEAGQTDEFHLQFGMRILAAKLDSLGIKNETLEFEGGHFGMDRRYPEVLAKLAARLSG